MKKHDIYIIVITLIIALSIQGFYMFSKKEKVNTFTYIREENYIKA